MKISHIQSVFSGALALLIIGTISYLAIRGFQIPEILTQVALVIVGFYFGQAPYQRENKDHSQGAKQ